MTKLKIKLIPLILTILSGLYFFYVLSSENTTLSADTVGGDPGGKVLPMVMAIFMFFGFLYITIKERPDEDKMSPQTKQLFFITLLLSVLYVFSIRYIGFIILSTILLFSLEYIYTTIGEDKSPMHLVYGCLGSVGVTTTLYFIMRVITRNLMRLGRTGVLPEIFASPVFQGGISMVYVTLVTILLNKTVCQNLKARGLKRASDAGLLTVATILFLYVVFKQFFSVNLAPGLLNF